MTRGWQVAIACAVGGCDEPLIDGHFTEAEWAYLQTFRLDVAATCADGIAPALCNEAAFLGRIMFFERGFSGPLQVASDLGEVGESGRVSCASCHVPTAWFADDRSEGGTSLGVGWTRRNAPSLVNAAFQDTFTWDSRYGALAAVLDAPLYGASLLASSDERLAEVVCSRWLAEYEAAFDASECDDPARVKANVAVALEAYQRQLVSGDAPLDRYLAGDTSAISESAKRGAKLFIGEAHCADCHSGPLLSDGELHVTGVAQRGLHAPEVDEGADGRGFRTPPLRQVAETAPYMHTGALPSLGDVMELYRWGGDDGGFVGDKDPLMVPLEITGADVADLIAFMETFTGEPVAPLWLEDPTR